MTTVGVLALQGAVTEHLDQLRALGVRAVAVRQPEALATLDGLIIPGGESTTISRLIGQYQLTAAIQRFARQRPVMGTCAGLILCARDLQPADPRVTPLGLIDITVTRNGFGRQVDSFETMLAIPPIGDAVPAVFIRAPYILAAGDGVTVLARVDDRIVMAEQGNVLVTAFHPELTPDTRILQWFLRKIPR